MTGALNLLLSTIGLHPKVWNRNDTSDLPDAIVLVGPWEHHSNLLPWRYFIDPSDDLSYVISGW